MAFPLNFTPIFYYPSPLGGGHYFSVLISIHLSFWKWFPLCYCLYTLLPIPVGFRWGWFLPPTSGMQIWPNPNQEYFIALDKMVGSVVQLGPSWVNWNNTKIMDIAMIRNLNSGSRPIWFDFCQKYHFKHIS